MAEGWNGLQKHQKSTFFSKKGAKYIHNPLLTSTNYYPYGMLLPERNGNATEDEYRYAFNGMTADEEIKGERSNYDFGARMYDPRVGRFLSRDPKFKNVAKTTFIQGHGQQLSSIYNLDFWNFYYQAHEFTETQPFFNSYTGGIVKDGNAKMFIRSVIPRDGKIPNTGSPKEKYRQSYNFYSNREIILNIFIYGSTAK